MEGFIFPKSNRLGKPYVKTKIQRAVVDQEL